MPLSKSDELIMHSGEGDAVAVERLLREGVNPDCADRDGFTALHLAAEEGRVDVARVLIEQGATVDSVNKYGNTPLWGAVFNFAGDDGMITLLRNSGANANHRNAVGRTPTELARTIATTDVERLFVDVD